MTSAERYFPAVLKRQSIGAPYLMAGIAGKWFWTRDLEQAMRMTPAAATQNGKVCGSKVKLRDYSQERALNGRSTPHI